MSFKEQLFRFTFAVLTVCLFSHSFASELYIPNNGDFVDVSVVDTDLFSEVSRITVSDPSAPRRPYAVAFSPDGQFAFSTLQSSDEVVVIDALTQAVANRIQMPGLLSCPLAVVGPNGNRLYLPDLTDVMYVIDIATQQVIDMDPATIPIDGLVVPPALNPGIWEMDFSPDGQFAYFSAADNPQGVVRLNVITETFDMHIPVAFARGFTNGLKVSPNGTTVFVTGGEGVIAVDLTSNTEVGRFDCGEGTCVTQGIQISADSTTAYVVDALGNDLYVLDITDPSNIQLVWQVPLATSGGFGPWEIVLDGDLAYITGQGRSGFPTDLIEVDLSVSPPVHLRSLPVGNSGFEMALRPEPLPGPPPGVPAPPGAGPPPGTPIPPGAGPPPGKGPPP